MPIILVLTAIGLILLAGGSLLGVASGTGNGGTAPLFPESDNTPAPGWIMKPGNITSNPATWPSGDVIWNICQAIAYAEGANVSGSVPDRLNNPGDISDGGSTYPQESHSGSSVTKFPDKATGWQWLYNKVQNIADGGSSVYSPSMTWNEIAQRWAGNWQNWVNNVTATLGVSPDSTFQDYTG